MRTYEGGRGGGRRVCAAPLAALCLALAAALPARAASLQLELMTSPELRQRIAAGATTVLVPIGGTEQNGPHMVLGKHNVRAAVLAMRIAERLGDTLVAPVMAYVPEGSIDPPTQHMRWAGTLSIPSAAFEATLEGAARSLRRHGFCRVVFLGDHGGYQASLARVATALNRSWSRNSACRAMALPEYYRAADAGYAALLKARGFKPEEIGTHAGLADTALALAVDPALVRAPLAAARTPPPANARTDGGEGDDGVRGDPRRATAELGRVGVEHIVDAAVAAIRGTGSASGKAAR